MWKGSVVWLCSSLNQAERRSALTHELQHLSRGRVDAPWRAREERIVDELAARKLISLQEFLLALQWSQDDYELADMLWTDVHTVRVRRETLTEVEKSWLSEHLDDGMDPC